jgi:hypothetical protein
LGVDVALVLLDRLERTEAHLLTWGVPDASFTESEILEAAEAVCQETGVDDAQGLIDDLLRKRLLLRFELGDRSFRTRMSETVRLLARLKQWFPRQKWQVAPNLVADYRFGLQARLYPRRVISEKVLGEMLASSGDVSPAQKNAAVALCAARKLSDFQADSTRTILRELNGTRSRGVIVTAGTGTGKTLAFYLPVFAWLTSGDALRDGSTKVLTLYPRRELLKDQLTTACRQVLAIPSADRRPRLGAVFGDTPMSAMENDWRRKNWRVVGDRVVCPFVSCPQCGQSMVWSESDRKRDRERLVCERDSGHVLGEPVLSLTHKSMQKNPPDVLFTTTEMLNRHLSNTWSNGLFGVGARRPPRVVLLDEVHTYAGTHGAQVALLLRRWHHAVGRYAPVEYVGLSATLADAGDFFAQITGLDEAQVSLVEPKDMERKGSHYQILLRGDPFSPKALLSTTIQTAMLVRRMLDPLEGAHAEGIFGKKTFVFTDDLDVTNRLHLQLNDAEEKLRLPALRASGRADGDDIERMAAGQTWTACEQIGHDLDRVPRTGRTSSQDPGVDPMADLVVATASLELGYDDAAVGAVIQHKAPREVAGYIQRVGRAGRDPQMRPWSIAVLSDYGRDRAAYQSYETLFSPVLHPRRLPIRNRYVLRMQVVYAFFEWMSVCLARKTRAKGSVWNECSNPMDNASAMERQATQAQIVDEVLRGPDGLREELRQYLGHALQLPLTEVDVLLWEPPRALLSSVLPTLRRRLLSRWRRYVPGVETIDREQYAAGAPLPEFVPANLFSDLNLPEVRIVWPSNERRGGSDALPLVQAMRSFAPGKVNMRYAMGMRERPHWVAPSSVEGPIANLPIDRYCSHAIAIGDVQYQDGDSTHTATCYRPSEIALDRVPDDVRSNSNATLDWRMQLARSRQSTSQATPPGACVQGIVQETEFLTHAAGNPARIRRFALGSRATIVRERAHSPVDVYVRVTERDGRTPAAVGFEMESDAIVFRVQLPDGILRGEPGLSGAALRGLFAAWFRESILTDSLLRCHANRFQLDRLHEILLSVLTAIAAGHQVPIEAAWKDAFGSSSRLEELIDGALVVIFQSLELDDAEEQNNVRDQLHELLHTESVFDRLRDIARCLWEGPAEVRRAQWIVWLTERFTTTLGTALLEACGQSCSHVGDADLLLDPDSGAVLPGSQAPTADTREIWITESTPGGTGLIEQVRDAFARDPRRFFEVVQSCLGPSDRELVDAQLTRTVALLAEEAELRTLFERRREAVGHSAIEATTTAINLALAKRGVMLTHAVRSALNVRLLHPASSARLEQIVHLLLGAWDKVERRTGVEIDLRVFAVVVAKDLAIRKELDALVANHPTTDAWYFQRVHSVLWPRGRAARSGRAPYSPFRELPETDRHLVLYFLRQPRTVEFGSEGWEALVIAALGEEGRVVVTTPIRDRREAAAWLSRTLTVPITVGFLALYPVVAGTEVWGDMTHLHLRLREVPE